MNVSTNQKLVDNSELALRLAHGIQLSKLALESVFHYPIVTEHNKHLL